MRQSWENKEVDGRGTRYCLVIDPEDGTHPIRTYGFSKEEVLEKVARTAGTAQSLINQRRQQDSRERAAPVIAVPPTPAAPTPEELMTATSDLTNPAKSPQAVRTLLRGAGLDVDALALREAARAVGAVAQQWERDNPDFPNDGKGKNQRLLMDRAILLADGRLGDITADHLTRGFQYLQEHGLLFEAVAPEVTPAHDADATNDGNSDSRGEGQRTATTYRRDTLRTTPPVRKTPPPKHTAAEIDKWTSKQLREKIETDPAFAEAYNRGDFSRPATA
jgi:hypothetical protein